MTCHYTNTHWRDALYNAVRKSDEGNGINAAAQFLESRRGVPMHPESLRRKLRGKDHLDVDLAVLLAEFVGKDKDQHKHANDWLLALCAQEGLCVDDVPTALDVGLTCEAKALQDRFLALAAKMGKIASVTAQTTADSRIDQEEADQLVPLLRATRELLHRMERNVLRGVAKGRVE